MESSQLPSLERSDHMSLTPVQRMLAAEFVNISLTDRPQTATGRTSATSTAPRQSQGQEQGSLAQQLRRQNERAAQVAFYSQRAISVFSRNPASVEINRSSLQPYTNAHDAFQEIDQSDALRIRSYTGTQNPPRSSFQRRGRVCRDEHQMWLLFRYELLRLETNLATEFSEPVKLLLFELIKSWRDKQSFRGAMN